MTAACLLRSAHAVILCGSRYVEGCARSVCQRLYHHRHQSNRCNKRCASGQHARHSEVQLPDPWLDLHEAHSRQRCGWHVFHGLATPKPSTATTQRVVLTSAPRREYYGGIFVWCIYPSASSLTTAWYRPSCLLMHACLPCKLLECCILCSGWQNM